MSVTCFLGHHPECLRSEDDDRSVVGPEGGSVCEGGWDLCLVSHHDSFPASPWPPRHGFWNEPPLKYYHKHQLHNHNSNIDPSCRKRDPAFATVHCRCRTNTDISRNFLNMLPILAFPFFPKELVFFIHEWQWAGECVPLSCLMKPSFLEGWASSQKGDLCFGQAKESSKAFGMKGYLTSTKLNTQKGKKIMLLTSNYDVLVCVRWVGARMVVSVFLHQL